MIVGSPDIVDPSQTWKVRVTPHIHPISSNVYVALGTINIHDGYSRRVIR